MEQNYPVKQIWPAHADHISYYKDKFIDNLFNNEVIVQRKYDGERMLVHFNQNETYCTSRRISKKTNRYMENQDKIKNIPMLDLDYTVIDCECYADTWSDAVGVLHSLSERAMELQNNITLKFAVFDCIFYDGQDIRHLPYKQRIEYAKKVLNKLNYERNDFRFHYVEQFIAKTKDEAYKIAEMYWNEGKEGVVIKSAELAYYDKGAMLKLKKTETIDVVVYSYQQGTGKYTNTVGALLVGYYDEQSNSIKHLSKVNCGTDADRDWWKNYFASNNTSYQVLEVKCQEITDKSLRHPVYIRIRDDKDYKMCTRDTIFKE